MPLVTPPRQPGAYVTPKQFGAVGDGINDDTAAVQAAINATAGKVLLFPKGKYKITSTLFITDRMHHLVGEFCGRNVDGGTELAFSGLGPCIQIGADAAVNWNLNYYLGPQDHQFENLWISHSAPDTALDVVPGGAPQYKGAAYGIWDWYGGGLIFKNMGFERFEASFVGIQSDIDSFSGVTSLYSKYGIYLGPRSDQFTMEGFYSFFCERAITIDGTNHVRIVDAQIVGCGNATAAAIEVRRGSASIRFERPWLEHLQGYGGTDQVAFVSAGTVNGYGPGGSIAAPGGAPNTLPIEALSIHDALVYTSIVGAAFHTQHMVTVGKCRRLIVDSPTMPAGSTIGNFDSLVDVPATQAPTNIDTQIEISGVSSDIGITKLYTNSGGGAPAPSLFVRAQGQSGNQFYSDTGSRFHIRRAEADALKDIFIGSENNVGGFFVGMTTNPAAWVTLTPYGVGSYVRANNKIYQCTIAGVSGGVAPSHGAGTAVDGTVTWLAYSASIQSLRVRLIRALQQDVAVPAAGDWAGGDIQLNSAPGLGGTVLWQCYATGTPGSWQALPCPMKGSALWTPNIANGAVGAVAVAVGGASVGDIVSVGFSQAVPDGVLLSGQVTGVGTVRVTALNQSGGLWNPAQGTITAMVWKAT